MDSTIKSPFLVEVFEEGRIAGQQYANAGDLLGYLAPLDLAAVSSSIALLVDEMAAHLRPRPGGPSQCEVQFGLKISAEGGIIVSKMGGEVSMTVKVVWERD